MPSPPGKKSLSFAHYRVLKQSDGSPIELGRGAMGVTYKAVDERLRMEVALKVITPSQVDDPKTQALFLREARTAAQVRHPNVAAVVFLNDAPGKFFYAMEFVEGETVEAFVRRRGPLPARLALRIIQQAAQGLAAANERGLIHRDIKPANLMLARLPDAAADEEEDDGLLVKVIDFGLAKSIIAEDPGAAISLSGHGPVGTPNYMSPEQISPAGETLDARTDIYSLGVTLWYLLLGRPPFEGTSFEVLSKQMQSPPPWEKLTAAGVPPDVDALLHAMLAKSPAERPANYPALFSSLKRILRSGTTLGGGPAPAPHATNVADRSDATLPLARPGTSIFSSGHATSTLSPARPRWHPVAIAVGVLIAAISAWRMTRPAVPPSPAALPEKMVAAPEKNAPAPEKIVVVPEKSIAVLPFENLSSDQENAYFANGMQEEILTDISRIADLKVISRSSVMQYKSSSSRNLREIGQALGVAYVLEGSVQRAGGKVRVTAQLIDTRTDAHVWANRYDGDLADVFGIQSQIAENIAGQLKARLTPAEKATLAERPTDDLQAYELFLRARELGGGYFNLVTAKANALEAVRLLDEAVVRDPNFHLAYVALANMHDYLFWFNHDRTPARLALAQAAIDQAVRLRPDAGTTQVAQAKHLYWGYRDYDRAREHLALAQRLMPNEYFVPFLTGMVDRRQGRWKESNRNVERAMELNPQGRSDWGELISSYFLERMYPEAQRAAKALVSLNPRTPELRVLPQILTLAATADPAPLREEIAAQIAKDPASAPNLARHSLTLALMDRDPTAAASALAAMPRGSFTDENGFTFPKTYFDGLAARTFHDDKAAEVAFTTARVEAAQRVTAQPNDAQTLVVLALIDAGLGRREDALREARLACEMLPVEFDTFDGASVLYYATIASAWLAEKDLAIGQLDRLGRIPSMVNYGDLKLNPDWDALRGDPRFEAIVAGLKPSVATPKP